MATVCIIGSGAAGLITAHILKRDGFTVQIITRDKTPGGVWCAERVYPGLTINNVHGEFRFSSMPMPSPPDDQKTGGRLRGTDMLQYMQAFTRMFLENDVLYESQVVDIQRKDSSWLIRVRNVRSLREDVLTFSHLVLCTGGCDTPNIPPYLSPVAGLEAGFTGPIIHSRYFGESYGELLQKTEPKSGNPRRVVVVGGGKSGQDVAACLTSEGRKVTIVFDTSDAILAAAVPLPDFIRKSRFLSIMSPHIDLESKLQRFLHKTWIGAKIVHAVWFLIQWHGFNSFGLPQDSPLRRAHSLFWSARINDEGAPRSNSFFSLVNRGEIDVICPAKVTGLYTNGVVINDTTKLEADAIVLATGYTSSWTGLFEDQTAEEVGIGRHSPLSGTEMDEWKYTSLANPPPAHPMKEQQFASIYRGIVPAKNILREDLAMNGAMFTSNNGYTFEVVAHWISAYFKKELRNVPSSVEEATAEAERKGRWLRKRYPDFLLWINESYSSTVEFFSWPQYTDGLLRDMGCRALRSGGNWLTWPFKVIDLDEIAGLKEERDALRQ